MLGIIPRGSGSNQVIGVCHAYGEFPRTSQLCYFLPRTRFWLDEELVRRPKLRERSLPHRSASFRAKRCGFCIAVMKRALDVLSEALGCVQRCTCNKSRTVGIERRCSLVILL
jgi:hypothetical protein